MEKKLIFSDIYKNRFLILSCLMLISGTIFGTSMLRFLPEEVLENLYGFLSEQTENFPNEFINRFFFPFAVLMGLYFSGSGIFGRFTAPVLVFIYGSVFGLENSLKFMFSGADYLMDSMILFFSGTFFFGFSLLIMSENSIFSSKGIVSCIKGKNDGKPLYNAKKQAIKFAAFTACFIIISAFSAFITQFLRPRI